ncbi:LytTR family DNA-binding domain-containing protein [Clostridium estertheticum]|uniref:LytTR family DNA-binding domain-containing protein n=2 Tax=Clostridium estertheticum TaxID=238834 RepID=UPI001C0AB058|nr:LytTR family DNA-binding domain-containing protein [Clostridium estertheticum]MBU3075885.1 LytTR family transcriptional regulator DNA-binding domain-containing protein [Clostridium estertheticum]MBU3165999.1 LytTR family transcriptional regulator DNA-binding domain-containing protein [Clostridium estertheticum]
MDIIIVEDKESNIEVQIRYPIMNVQVRQLIQRIKGIDMKIVGSNNGKNIVLNICDIFYIESIERKTFIYTKDQVLKSSKKLYQLIDELTGLGFIQINKACIMNIDVLDSVNTLFNSRLKATLINGENVIITRTYIPAIKKWLEGEAQHYEK